MKKMQPKKSDLVNSLIYWGSKPYVFVVVIAFLMVPSCHLARALESGADFLNIAVGARPVGMGSAYTAVADDINAIYWNPAGLASLSKKEIGAMHSQWLLGSNYDFVGFGLPVRKGVLGFGISRLSQGDFESRAANRQSLGSFKAFDQSFSLAFGRPLGERSSFGVGVKFIQSRIGQDSASSFALDFGILHRVSNYPVSIGLAVQNLGPGMKFISQSDPLPLSITAGLAYRILPGMNMALDVKRLINDQETVFNFGTEYQLLGAMALRSGYAMAGNRRFETGGGKGFGIEGLTGGVGLMMMGTRLDYAITPFGDFGNSHRISLNCKF